MKLKTLHKFLLFTPLITAGCLLMATDFSKTNSIASLDEGPAINFDLVRKIKMNPTKKGKKKTQDERAMFHWARVMHEYYQQVNPITGTVSRADKAAEMKASKLAPIQVEGEKAPDASLGNFVARGPGNLGGRTRAIAFDALDATGNTILAGAISGGVFRTTNGGGTWTKVSPSDEQHNVTSIAQDPRVGNQNIWYYSTGEGLGNSTSAGGAFYTGFGVWRSTDNGLSWTQMSFPVANNEFNFDDRFDIITRLAVHPTTGDLFVACLGRIYRFDISASNWITEQTATGGFNTSHLTDVVITTGGRVYTAFSGAGPAAQEGVWTSNNAMGAAAGTWSRIGADGSPTGWNQNGRAVLGLAPSNQNILYVLYESDASTPSPGDSDLWRWNQGTTTWTNFSNKIPDEPGGSAGNDPFDTQGGYDMVVSVKPDNENFVVIGSTNAYKVTNINSGSFVRIGGYNGPSTYALWTQGGGAEHHSDIHTLVFNPANVNQLLSGGDGGVHRTIDVTAGTVGWVNLNNDYRTYQYYHVSLDPQSGSNGVLGGAQDNGTTAGGTTFGFGNNTDMARQFSGDGCAAAISRDNACVPFFMTSQSGNLVRDCPTGATITPTGSSSDFVTYFWLDPDNNANIYYAGQNTLYKSNNSTNVTSAVGTGGTQWRNLGTLPGTEWINTMTTTRGAYSAASNLFIGGDEGGIYRLTNPANATNLGALATITPPGATTGFPSIVSGLAVHPSNPNILLAGYANYGTQSLFLSTNATAGSPTWVNVERNIAALSIRSVVIVEAGGATLYVAGTARGLFTSPDPTTTDWTRVGTTSVGFAVVSSLRYRPADNVLLIGTHGNGMFTADVLPPVLPVELISFQGQMGDNQIDLTWKTASEENNEGFELQRSFNATDFEVIGFVNGKGTSTQTQKYQFPDPDISAPIQYYRLRQVDFDESEVFSNVVAVETGLGPNEGVYTFNTYPNPVKDVLNIEFNRTPKTGVDVEIFSSKGDRVYYKRLTQQSRLMKLNFAKDDLAQGLFILRLTEDGKVLGVQKIHKIR